MSAPRAALIVATAAILCVGVAVVALRSREKPGDKATTPTPVLPTEPAARSNAPKPSAPNASANPGPAPLTSNTPASIAKDQPSAAPAKPVAPAAPASAPVPGASALAVEFQRLAGVPLDERIVFAEATGEVVLPALTVRAGTLTWTLAVSAGSAASAGPATEVTARFDDLDLAARTLTLRQVGRRGQTWDGAWKAGFTQGVLRLDIGVREFIELVPHRCA